MEPPSRVVPSLGASRSREQRQAVIVAIASIVLNAGLVAFLMMMVALQHS